MFLPAALTSFEAVREVNDWTYTTFCEACQLMNLSEDDT